MEIEESQMRTDRIEAEILSYESFLKILEDAGKFGDGMKLSPTEFVNGITVLFLTEILQGIFPDKK